MINRSHFRTALNYPPHPLPPTLPLPLPLQVELMQGKHMLLQLDKKPPASYGVDGGGRPNMAVVLRVEALDQEGLLHRLVDRIRALCKGQKGHDAERAAATAGGDTAVGEGGARLEQYGLRGHTGSAVMEFLIAGAAVRFVFCFCFLFSLFSRLNT